MVLEETAAWLEVSDRNNQRLNSLICMHRITDDRIGMSVSLQWAEC